jgi:hypothetical protein
MIIRFKLRAVVAKNQAGQRMTLSDHQVSYKKSIFFIESSFNKKSIF